MAVDGQTLFIGTASSGIFRSTNRGLSWTAVNSGLTVMSVHSIAVAPNGKGGLNIYAGTLGGGVFLSTNYGGNWMPANSGLVDMNVMVLTVDSLYAGQGGFAIYAGGASNGSVSRSTNGGASWTSIRNGLPLGSYYGIGVGRSPMRSNYGKTTRTRSILRPPLSTSFQVEVT